MCLFSPFRGAQWLVPINQTSGHAEQLLKDGQVQRWVGICRAMTDVNWYILNLRTLIYLSKFGKIDSPSRNVLFKTRKLWSEQNFQLIWKLIIIQFQRQMAKTEKILSFFIATPHPLLLYWKQPLLHFFKIGRFWLFLKSKLGKMGWECDLMPWLIL